METTTIVFTVFLVLVSFISRIEFTSCKRVANLSCIESERQALIAFKESLVDPSNRLSSWVGEDCCAWEGVGCSKRSGHVVKLNLRNPNPFDTVSALSNDNYAQEYVKTCLGGELNPSLLELKHLTRLDLSMNMFSGIPIPNSIGSFSNLKYLNLSFAGFGGEVAYHLGNLSSLQYLDLSVLLYSDLLYYELSIDDLQWISMLPELQVLRLSGVNLEKPSRWLQAINMLPSLIELRLDNCQLYHILPSLQVNFTSLVTLDLHENFLNSTIPPWLFNITNLEYLDLSHNSFLGFIPEEIEHTKFLEVLDLSRNSLRGKIPKNISNLCNLHEFSVNENRISGDIFNILGRSSRCALQSLEHLSLSINGLTGQIPHDLRQFQNLKYLDLSGNKLNGSVPESIGQLQSLEVLKLSNNSLKGTISEHHFSNLSSLFELNMESNTLAFNVSSSWIPPFQLAFIYLSSCEMGPQFPKWLQTQTQLSEISMANAGITDVLPDWFNNISSQSYYLKLSNNQIHGPLPSFPQIYERHIFLDSNKFDGPLPVFHADVILLDLSDNLLSDYIPQSIGYMMPEMFILRLSNNKFIGTLPESLCQMESLQVLDVSKNQLTGKFPRCWNNSERLTVIDVSENSFSGLIPWSLGSIPSLQSIHLHENKFYGELPESLKNLTNLQTLDLGHNAFYGVIPSWLGENLASLRFLSLESNHFVGEIPLQICNLSALQLLNLAQNNLNGTIPHCFRNFTSMIVGTEDLKQRYPIYQENILLSIKVKAFDLAWLEHEHVFRDPNSAFHSLIRKSKMISSLRVLDLSRNALQGEIVKNLSNLCNLHEFYSIENRIHGDISNTLGSSSTCALQSLELESQHKSTDRKSLGGKMVKIGNLKLLESLDLAGNELAGNQLQTLDDPSVYLGNSKLCGYPLKSCSEDKPSSNGGHEDVNENRGKDILTICGGNGGHGGNAYFQVVADLLLVISNSGGKGSLAEEEVFFWKRWQLS
ncbi:Leucine-rich repeat-containing N-terminal, plant-type [Dillenia turbinata]|uniref:Leucine-rich repeat-containing N-terminal, plant-type n=1 Tax=Dillenia turbinata TaxID=194707 RepID=A0AAN8UT89_9MAGN